MKSSATGNRYEKLRRILEAELQRPIKIEEAREVGDGLVELFLALANGRNIVRGDVGKVPNSTRGKRDNQIALTDDNLTGRKKLSDYEK